MSEKKLVDLKEWRRKFGLSQKKLAEAAKVSLATLRHLEIGRNKPQKRTLKRIDAAMKAVEVDDEVIADGGKKDTVSRVSRRRRGQLKKSATSKRGVGRPRKVATVEQDTDRSPEFNSSGPVRLTNLDLELINRILALDSDGKLEILRLLMHRK